MAYNATYASTDIAPAAIDTIVTVIAAMVAFGTLVGIVLVYSWAKKHVR